MGEQGGLDSVLEDSNPDLQAMDTMIIVSPKSSSREEITMDHIHHTHPLNTLMSIMKATLLHQWTPMALRQTPMVFLQTHMAPHMLHHLIHILLLLQRL